MHGIFQNDGRMSPDSEESIPIGSDECITIIDVHTIINDSTVVNRCHRVCGTSIDDASPVTVVDEVDAEETLPNENTVQQEQKLVEKQGLNTETKRVTCHNCNKSFATMTVLRRHAREAHLGDKRGRRPKCQHCQKQFTRTWDLQRHVRVVHMRDRPYQCAECDRRFSERSTLKQHIIKIHKHKHL